MMDLDRVNNYLARVEIFFSHSIGMDCLICTLVHQRFAIRTVIS